MQKRMNKSSHGTSVQLWSSRGFHSRLELLCEKREIRLTILFQLSSAHNRKRQKIILQGSNIQQELSLNSNITEEASSKIVVRTVAYERTLPNKCIHGKADWQRIIYPGSMKVNQEFTDITPQKQLFSLTFLSNRKEKLMAWNQQHLLLLSSTVTFQ